VYSVKFCLSDVHSEDWRIEIISFL
jgi:hypothetical protein